MEPSSSREVSAYRRIDADHTEDWIPLVSTVTNFIDLVEKYMWKGKSQVEKNAVDPIEKKYYSYLETKSVGKCLLLSIPVINLLVKLFDYLMRGAWTNERALQARQTDPVPDADSEKEMRYQALTWEAARQGNIQALERIQDESLQQLSDEDYIELLEIQVNKLSDADFDLPAERGKIELELANRLLLKGKTQEARDHFQNVIRKYGVSNSAIGNLTIYNEVWSTYTDDVIGKEIQDRLDSQTDCRTLHIVPAAFEWLYNEASNKDSNDWQQKYSRG